MAQDLTLMLSQMSGKFDESFADQSPVKPKSPQRLPSAQLENDDLNELQLQSPIKTEMFTQENSILTSEHLQSRLDESREKSDANNIKDEIDSLTKCQIQISATQKPIEEAFQKNDEKKSQNEEEFQNEKPLALEGETDQNDDVQSYQSLTQKFEVALAKVKHNQSINSTKSEFTSRQEHYQRKKTTEINLLRAQKEKEVTKMCTAKPLINNRSQKLLLNHKPIHIRFQAVIEEKKKKIQTQVSQKMAKQVQEELLQLHKIRQHQQQIKKKLGNDIRSEQEYYNQMQDWVESKKRKLDELAQKKTEQFKQETPFKPSINQKSQIIMKKYASRVPIYQQTPVPKKVTVDSNCTFKPNLNKTSKK